MVTHLLIAQAHIPPTELVEVAPAYVSLFAQSFPEVGAGTPIDFTMFGRAVAEFEFTLTRANAPIDRFARGYRGAMSSHEKEGALVFFGKGRCVQCHAVSGGSNEMSSDFQMHNIGVPPIAPRFGAGRGNVVFDGPGENEDFGLAQITGQKADRYLSRSSPLRNVSLQPTFFHNGAFTWLEDPIRHHLDPVRSTQHYDAAEAGAAPDLRHRRGPTDELLATLDPLLRDPIRLDRNELDDLLEFVGRGLLDPKARASNLCGLVPQSLPSGRSLASFQGC